MADKDEGRQVLPFADALQKMQGGRTHRDLSTALQELVRSVVETGKSGTLTLQVKVSKSKINGAIELLDSVAVKKPQADRSVSLFFPDAEFNLHRTDPRQLELSLGPVRLADEQIEEVAQ